MWERLGTDRGDIRFNISEVEWMAEDAEQQHRERHVF